MTAVVQRRLERYPAVALLGPRQCGKTTLAKTLSRAYFDLEQPEDRLRLDLAWNELCASRALIILDEAQTWPQVFPRIRGAIDAQRKRSGRFLLLGSIAPSLMTHVSESLAGRLAICELAPLMLSEVGARASADWLWLKGGFPDGGILGRGFPDWQQQYLTVLAQRDLPMWGLPAKPQLTARLFQMLAACHGQRWNGSEIGKSLGLSYHTVNSYLAYLQGAYLITVLPPYVKNLKKRLVKRPKIYWQDSGLLHSLRGCRSVRELLSQPWVGSSWEGWVIHQILSAVKATGQPFEAFYFNTSDQHEVDLVLRFAGQLWAIEIKLTTSPDPGDFARLNQTADWIQAGQRVLISRTRRSVRSGSGMSTHLAGCLERLRAQAKKLV